MPASAAGELSRRFGFLLAQLGTHAHRRFAERLARLDLHPRHFGMLSHLGASEGQSQQALSVALGIHRSAVVALVDDLEHRGLAERRRDPVDRRAYTLYLTPAGLDPLTDLERVADERDVELLSALDASERSQLIVFCGALPNDKASRRAFIRIRSRERATIVEASETVRPSTPALGDSLAEGCRPRHPRQYGRPLARPWMPLGEAAMFRQPEPNVGASAGAVTGTGAPAAANQVGADVRL